MGFSKNIVTAIENRKFAPEIFAGLCGITQNEMDTYIKADICPDPPTLRKMADVLKLKVSDIAGDDDLTFTSFGKELGELRKKGGMSRNELGTLIDKSNNSIAKYELNLCKTPKDVNEKLTDLFGDDYVMLMKKYKVDEKPQAKAKTKPKRLVSFVNHPKTPEDRAYGKEIGAAIHEARKDLGVTIQYAASLLDVSPTTFVRLENGYIPTGSLVGTIKSVLGVDISKIKRPEAIVTSKPEAVAPSKPEVVAPSKPEMVAPFKPVWIDYLDMIEDDSEYRKASTALLNHVFNGVVIPTLDDAPQANIILKMIKMGA